MTIFAYTARASVLRTSGQFLSSVPSDYGALFIKNYIIHCFSVKIEYKISGGTRFLVQIACPKDRHIHPTFAGRRALRLAVRLNPFQKLVQISVSTSDSLAQQISLADRATM